LIFERNWDHESDTKATVKKIAEQVKVLPESELEDFLFWLVEYEMGHSDEWDREVERDSQNGGL